MSNVPATLKVSSCRVLLSDATDDFNIGDSGKDSSATADDGVDNRTKQLVGGILPRKIAGGGGDAAFPPVEGGDGGKEGVGSGFRGNDEDRDVPGMESAKDNEMNDGVNEVSQRLANLDRHQYSRYGTWEPHR